MTIGGQGGLEVLEVKEVGNECGEVDKEEVKIQKRDEDNMKAQKSKESEKRNRDALCKRSLRQVVPHSVWPRTGGYLGDTSCH